MYQKRSFHMLFQFRVIPLTPLILKNTSQSNKMPDSNVLRDARTNSVNNLKTISEDGNILTFVSPSNTYDQRLKKVPFELEIEHTRSAQAKNSVSTHSSGLDILFMSQSFTCLLIHLCKNALPFQTSWKE